MNPRISIVIPSYNQSLYLEDCIESAYNQTLAPHEIIVVDDGSTDNSLEIANRYRFAKYPGIESPVKVIAQVNKGLPSARNTGIMNATGDYILFLDADDMLKENAIERIASTILESLSGIQGGADIIAPSFETFGLNTQTVILKQFTLDELKLANRLGYFCAIKRSVLLECGGYSPRMKYGWEDYHLWFDLLLRGKSILILQEPVVKYRIKEVSMIQDANAHSEELWAQIKKDFPQTR